MVQLTSGVGKRRLKTVEAIEQGSGLAGFHQAPGFQLKRSGRTLEAHSLDRITTGCQQLMAVNRNR